jgi:hypothetical protein
MTPAMQALTTESHYNPNHDSGGNDRNLLYIHKTELTCFKVNFPGSYKIHIAASKYFLEKLKLCHFSECK